MPDLRLGGVDQDATIVEAVINMAIGLRVEVIAEGVETEAQAQALRALGCGHAQGYLYGRPVAAGELGPLLERATPAGPGVAALAVGGGARLTS